jgi:serine/threonine-protein kinase
VERAVHKNVNVVPIRIEDAVPTRTMEYFISATHWFDAIEPPLENHLDRFAAGVARLLEHRSAPSAARGPQPERPRTGVHPAVRPSPPPAAPAPEAPAPQAPAAAPPAAQAAPAAEGIPSVLGNYEVGQFLTNGRYGSVVYVGTHRMLGNQVALRIFKAPAKERGAAVRERFLREARALQIQHPNIIHVKDFGEIGDVLYLVTDLLAGCSLHELIVAEGPLAPAKLQQFVRELADATEAVHRAKGLISGLRPEMIRVIRENASERIAISSAGVNAAQELMSVMNDAALRGQAAASELSYIAPELLMGKTADVRADLFTLGVLAYQMATGKVPFQGQTFPEVMGAMLMTRPQALAEVRPDLAPAAGDAIMRCLASDPQQRFASAAEFLAAWNAATGS